MRFRAFIACALAATVPAIAHAQFYSYPSFQLPRISSRDYNIAVADAGNAGTSIVFQWREFLNDRAHLQLDAGLADPQGVGASTRLIIGGSVAQRLRAATGDFPLDLVGTAGIGGSFGGGSTVLRIPLGVSAGHRFALDAPVAVTPYAHPRLSIDHCNRCGPSGRGDTNLGIDVDFGVSLQLSASLDIRAAAIFSGSRFAARDDGFGVSLAWMPK